LPFWPVSIAAMRSALAAICSPHFISSRPRRVGDSAPQGPRNAAAAALTARSTSGGPASANVPHTPPVVGLNAVKVRPSAAATSAPAT
jgi:hypothetical protein